MRHLYGASTADFAAQVVNITTTTDGAVNDLLQIAAGATIDVFDAQGGVQILDLLGIVSPTLAEGAPQTQVTALANGTIPFYGPDGVKTTLWLRADDGLGGFVWYPINPSKVGDLLDGLQTQVDGLGTGTSDFSGSYLDLTNVPSTFPAATHTHPANQISDSTSVGRGVVTAVDQQAARAAIGAGTGDGTSNLVIGTSATTAAAGNHNHNAANITATPFGAITGTDTQTQIQQVAATAGGTITGSSAILVWRYASGAYPAQPATKPTGASLMYAVGPTQPTTLPSWVGTGASDVVLFYDYAPLT